MITPEGRIKANVDALLKKYSNVYTFKPVQMGLGAAGLDYHCLVKVGDTPVAFFIECKAPGGKPTNRQAELIFKLKLEFRCNVFIIDGFIGLTQLKNWLDRLEEGRDNDTASRTYNKSRA